MLKLSFASIHGDGVNYLGGGDFPYASRTGVFWDIWRMIDTNIFR